MTFLSLQIYDISFDEYCLSSALNIFPLCLLLLPEQHVLPLLSGALH